MNPATQKDEKNIHLWMLLMDDTPEDPGKDVEKKDKG